MITDKLLWLLYKLINTIVNISIKTTNHHIHGTTGHDWLQTRYLQHLPVACLRIALQK